MSATLICPHCGELTEFIDPDGAPLGSYVCTCGGTGEAARCDVCKIVRPMDDHACVVCGAELEADAG
ncbi:MAG: hypothetical protein ACYDGR_00730 [Candidatus Dormibacteria bacterium]